ncbi:MAG: GDP-mannose 4,6-dehydratase [Candidatus Woesearchaeota archaeon]
MNNENFWRNRNVFVTGAPGLLGSHIVEELLSRKANVIALVRDFVSKSDFFMQGNDRKVTIVKGSLTDYQTMERAMNEYEVDSVFHLGAQAIVTTANRSPLSTFESNIRGTWNVMEAARVSKLVTRVVVASSDKAYGTQPVLPYTEEAPLQGEHPYDVSKSCTDLISQCYNKTYGLPVAITRCGNLYGAGDINWNRIIPGTIRSVYYNQQPVIRSDGSYIRDYFYLRDAADAYLKLAEQLDRPDVKGQAFNFSTMNKLSVLDIVKMVLKVMDSKLEPVVLNQVNGEIKHQYLSSEKAYKVLDWKPKYTIEEGMRETVKWYNWFFSEHG